MEILFCGKKISAPVIASRGLHEVYSFAHLEYDQETLAREYFCDLDAGLNPHLPENYFKNDDIASVPCLCWNLAVALFFNNLIHYAVCQETPFD
nr:homoserine O-succinyltransferase [Streptococcus intermedius]